jgi:hypothetical protein
MGEWIGTGPVRIAGWSEAVLYGCPPDYDPIPLVSGVTIPWPPEPGLGSVQLQPLTMPAWAQAQLAEMQRHLIDAQREIESLKRLLSAGSRRRYSRGNVPLVRPRIDVDDHCPTCRCLLLPGEVCRCCASAAVTVDDP